MLREFNNTSYIDGNTHLFQSLFSDESDPADGYENEDDVLEALEIAAREETDNMV